MKLLREKHSGWYSLLDAASHLTTPPLDCSDPTIAPDFTVLSFYKIFGYPDLGAIIVRRDTGHVLFRRRYFGGGTRVAITLDAFHAPREEIREALEDGTLPFLTILALNAAFNTFLVSLQHENGQPVCQFFSTPDQGPIVTFNLLSEDCQ